LERLALALAQGSRLLLMTERSYSGEKSPIPQGFGLLSSK
jgi:hypothetical protein